MQSLAFSDALVVISGKRDMLNTAAVRPAIGILVAAGVVLVALVVLSPHRFVYDEPYFVEYIALLHKFGPTPAFLNALTGTVGPLYAFVQAAFEPITGLQPTGMRLVNVFLLLVVIAILIAWLSRLGKVAAWSVGMTALAVPMVWVLAGLALSEMPAMALVTLSLCLQLNGLQSLENNRPVLGWFLASAVALGISVWGRQPYILLAGVPCLLALLERRLRIAAALFVVVVVVIALPQFVVWKGLVPPSHAEIQQGLAPKHALLSLGYAGVTMFLLAPLPGWRLRTWMVALFVVIAFVNVISDALVFYPLHTLTDRYVPPSLLSALGNLCGSVIATIGTIFVLRVLEVLWTDRRNLEQVAIHSGLLCMSLAPMFISHDFSSRYTAMALPYMLLAAHASRQWGAPNVITVLVGAVLGFLSLFSYLYL